MAISFQELSVLEPARVTVTHAQVMAHVHLVPAAIISQEVNVLKTVPQGPILMVRIEYVQVKFFDSSFSKYLF